MRTPKIAVKPSGMGPRFEKCDIPGVSSELGCIGLMLIRRPAAIGRNVSILVSQCRHQPPLRHPQLPAQEILTASCQLVSMKTGGQRRRAGEPLSGARDDSGHGAAGGTTRDNPASEIGLIWITAAPSGFGDLWRPFGSDPKVVQNHLGAVVTSKSCDISSGMARCAAQIPTT